MLKIKNGVDLKELEKYGFKLETDFLDQKSYVYETNYDEIELKLIVNLNKEIYIYAENVYDGQEKNYDILNPLHDLIKDGLIEKEKKYD